MFQLWLNSIKGLWRQKTGDIQQQKLYSEVPNKRSLKEREGEGNFFSDQQLAGYWTLIRDLRVRIISPPVLQHKVSLWDCFRKFTIHPTRKGLRKGILHNTHNPHCLYRHLKANSYPWNFLNKNILSKVLSINI